MDVNDITIDHIIDYDKNSKYNLFNSDDVADKNLKYNEFNFNDVKDNIRPLDIILFKGVDVISDTIRILEKYETENGDFSHIGMVITSELLPLIPQLKHNILYVLESTSSYGIPVIIGDTPPDVVSGHGRFGVQIRELQKVIDTYITKDNNAKVAWGKLIDNPWEKMTLMKDGHEKEIQKIMLVNSMNVMYQKYGRKIYELNIFDMFGALFPCFRKNRDIIDEFLIEDETIYNTFINEIYPAHDYIHYFFKSDVKTPTVNKRVSKDKELVDFRQTFVFCSELVTIVYQDLNILSKDIDPSDVVPIDFIKSNRTEIPKIIDDRLIYLTPLSK